MIFLSYLQVSDDGKLIGYGVDLKGNEQYGLYVRPIPAYPANFSGNGLSGRAFGPVANTDGRCVWAADNSTFFVATQVWPCACSRDCHLASLTTPSWPCALALVRLLLEFLLQISFGG